MKNIFTLKLHPKVRPNDILVKLYNTCGVKSLKTWGPKIWNQLLCDIKSETSYTKFEKYIVSWFGPKCRCNVCMNIWKYISVKCVLTLVRGLSDTCSKSSGCILVNLWNNFNVLTKICLLSLKISVTIKYRQTLNFTIIWRQISFKRNTHLVGWNLEVGIWRQIL